MKPPIKLEIYSDEIIIPGKFVGFGSLFVPINKKPELINSLLNLRCVSGNGDWHWKYEDCQYCEDCKEHWHNLNNSEVHHHRLRSSESHALKTISKNWINFLIENNKKLKDLIYFKILYIDLEKIDMSKFGTKKTLENLYNRFYRSNIKGGAKFFFNEHRKIIINRIYHDKSGGKESHDYFPWYTGYKINLDEDKKLLIPNEEIEFLDSNHKYYLNQNVVELGKMSHLIQFIDLLIGTSTQNIYNLSEDNFKRELAMKIRPLVVRLLNSPYNNHSSYNYHRKQDISFYPKNEISSDQLDLDEFKLDHDPDQFYHKKELKMPEYDPKIRSLDHWFF